MPKIKIYISLNQNFKIKTSQYVEVIFKLSKHLNSENLILLLVNHFICELIYELRKVF
jgi:hypothetical protein